MFDAMLNQEVFVVAPVMYIMADNPMSSELCNHQGNTARKFCRMCLVRTVIIIMALGKHYSLGRQSGVSRINWIATH